MFAYGQTGSGKTYTMGSAFNPNGAQRGVIPNVMDAIFRQISQLHNADVTVRAGFVEIHQVCLQHLDMYKPARPAGQAIQIAPLPSSVCRCTGVLRLARC